MTVTDIKGETLDKGLHININIVSTQRSCKQPSTATGRGKPQMSFNYRQLRQAMASDLHDY